jgi:hypothetical protein
MDLTVFEGQFPGRTFISKSAAPCDFVHVFPQVFHGFFHKFFALQTLIPLTLGHFFPKIFDIITLEQWEWIR